MREKLIELLGKAHSISAESACFDDATYAQQLEMEADHLIANGVTVQQWIPVTERLPEEWEPVLIFSCYGFSEVAVYLGIPGKWRVTWNHTMLDDNTVTHWMPLPSTEGLK